LVLINHPILATLKALSKKNAVREFPPKILIFSLGKLLESYEQI
jgi:hypothetical protein